MPSKLMDLKAPLRTKNPSGSAAVLILNSLKLILAGNPHVRELPVSPASASPVLRGRGDAAYAAGPRTRGSALPGSSAGASPRRAVPPTHLPSRKERTPNFRLERLPVSGSVATLALFLTATVWNPPQFADAREFPGEGRQSASSSALSPVTPKPASLGGAPRALGSLKRRGLTASPIQHAPAPGGGKPEQLWRRRCRRDFSTRQVRAGVNALCPRR